MSSEAGRRGDGSPLPGWIAAVHALSRVCGVVAAGMILVSIGVVCQMVFVRAVLGQSSIWQTEFVIFCLVAATFVGAPYIMLTRGHVAVDVVPLFVSTPVRRVLFVLGHLLSLGFCALFLYASIPWWHEVWVSNQTTPSIWRARLWIPYSAVPLGLGLLCLQMLTDLWLVITRREAPFGMAGSESS